MSEHIISRRTYTIVFAALMVLLVLSVWVAQFDFGRWNLVVAIGISVVKTGLIVLFFMHVIYASPLTRLIAVGGLLWLGIMMILAFSDYQSRDWHMPAVPAYRETAIEPGERPQR